VTGSLNKDTPRATHPHFVYTPHVEDIGAAVAAALQQPDAEAKTFECGGPRVYTYAEFLRSVAREAGLRPILMPFPFAAWHALAWMSELLPKPAITRNQIEQQCLHTQAQSGSRRGIRKRFRDLKEDDDLMVLYDGQGGYDVVFWTTDAHRACHLKLKPVKLTNCRIVHA
jgi:hypothetical protein